MARKILLPVDGSIHALNAARHLLALTDGGLSMDLVLLNVQPSLSGDVTTFIDSKTVADYHRDESDSACAEVRGVLDAAGLAYTLDYQVGTVAQTIATRAKEHGSEQIIMGCRGLGAVGSLVLGSVATKVVHLCDVPVTLVK